MNFQKQKINKKYSHKIFPKSELTKKVVQRSKLSIASNGTSLFVEVSISALYQTKS